MKKEKYIKANHIKNFIEQLKIEAMEKWDIDAVVVCSEIIEEIDNTIGKYIYSD